MKKTLLLLLLFFCLTACTDDKKYAPKEGRISVFDTTAPTTTKGTVAPDKDVEISAWTLPFYNLQNKLPNLKSNGLTQITWDERISKTSVIPDRPLAIPLVLEKALYVLDSSYTLIKTDVENGTRIWQEKLAQDKTGLSVVSTQQKLFALSTDGTLTALDQDGKQLWQKSFNTPTRAALMADKAALYLITAYNEFIVLNPKTGQELWRYQSVKPQTWLTKMASIAKAQNILIVPFATGEVIAFDSNSGLLLWVQMMVGERPQDLMEVPQIVANPVIDNGIVYLAGNANLCGAYELKTGQTKWTIPVGSTVTPIVSGNTLFVLSNQNKLIAVDKRTGKLFWEKEMPNESKSTERNLLLINSELVLQNGDRWIFVNPVNGEIIRTQKQKTATLPIADNLHLLILDSKLNATRY